MKLPTLVVFVLVALATWSVIVLLASVFNAPFGLLEIALAAALAFLVAAVATRRARKAAARR